MMRENYKEMDNRINKFEIEVSEAIRQSIQSLNLNSNPTSIGLNDDPALAGAKAAESVVTITAPPPT